MASHTNGNPVTPDTLITIKISVNDSLKKLKLPLRELGATVLPDKLRGVLHIKPEQTVVFERYSDSAGGYIILDETNAQVFKTLIRAAKAKLKLRLKATVTPVEPPEVKKEVMDEKLVSKTSESMMNAVRDSTAFDRRSVGSGIFQFREARASQQTLVNDEAPVPRAFTADRSSFFKDLAAPVKPAPSLVFRPRETVVPTTSRGCDWTVYCNDCSKAMENEHFHCSVCDDGNYDLCQECIDDGKLCPGEGHWLIKRFIQDGKVVNSTTERISPRKANSVSAFIKPEPTAEPDMPGAFYPAQEETKTLAPEPHAVTRTCNNCVIVLPEREFVTCTSCEDFDLCIQCHTADKHGHHPAHAFKPATEETVLPLAAETKLAAGRNVRHNAICDGCDKKIYGVRHKCLACPDWDYCNDCIKDARQSHPRHRFAALYTPIADQGPSMVRHFGIYCDGPLCSKKPNPSYIQGVRYKCTICHDTDFCASCEATPMNHHNRTHPLIKLKTPVRNVNVSTENEDLRGNVRVMGDRRTSAETKSAATETTPVMQANAATQVQTVADFQPTEVKKEETLPIPIAVKTYSTKISVPVNVAPPTVPTSLLNAHFVRDSVSDGMVVEPETRFAQVWTLKNPGPHVWPAGCSVRYVGGDNMLNVDNSHPASVTTINDATESNVVGRDVQVGEEIAFKVVLKAPAREGKSISYWRLKAADGTPFGHRLWCDVEVKKAVKQVTPPAVPSLMEQQRAAMEHQAAMQRMRIKQMQLARQMAPQPPPQPSQLQSARDFSPPVMPSEQPPAYDNNTLSARLAAMREQQKQRREQMIAQLNAQRDSRPQGIKREDMPMGWPIWPQHPNSLMANKATETANDKERQEALKQRVAHIKANLQKTREEREAMDMQKAAYTERKTAEETKKVEKIIEEVAKQADAEAQAAKENLEGSQMVFPKLDRESPASSTYQSATSSTSKGKAAYVENEEGEIERSATPVAAPTSLSASPTEEDFVDVDDDIEVLSALGDESDEDDGFLTDEEYDILDASDQETVASMK